MQKICSKQERREEKYLAPEVSVVSIAAETIVCQSPGLNPDFSDPFNEEKPW